MVVAAAITMLAMPLCADALTVKCANGRYMFCTVDEDFFGDPDEYNKYVEEITKIMCEEYGSTPA